MSTLKQRVLRARRGIDAAGGLIGRADIARRLVAADGKPISTARVAILARESEFPDPVAVIGQVHIYLENEVAAWARFRGRTWIDDQPDSD